VSVGIWEGVSGEKLRVAWRMGRPEGEALRRQRRGPRAEGAEVWCLRGGGGGG